MSVAKDTERAKGYVVNRGYQNKCDQLVERDANPRRTPLPEELKLRIKM
jgi:hypothetical protein